MYVNALTLYYIGRKAREARLPVVPRVCEVLTYVMFNCSIPASAEIGRGCRCGHRGMAVVVHPSARIGQRCLIRPQVVIGGTGTDSSLEMAPIIGDDVELGVGAKIIGSVRVGDRAVIGANAVVVDDVPVAAVAVGIPARVIGEAIRK